MKKLFIILFVLLFSVPASAMMIGDIETTNLTANKRIEFIDKEGPNQSAAFRYSDEIKIVIMEVFLCLYHRRFELDSLRYLKDGKLYYYSFDSKTKGYIYTRVSANMKEYWIKQLKKYADKS